MSRMGWLRAADSRVTSPGSGGIQRGGGGGEVLHGDEVHHQAATGFQALQESRDQPAELAARAADEHRVRVGPGVQAGRRLALEQAVVAARRRRALRRALAASAGFFSIAHTWPWWAMRLASRPDRAGTGADVPHQAVGAQREAASETARLELGDQALLRCAARSRGSSRPNSAGSVGMAVRLGGGRRSITSDVGFGEAPAASSRLSAGTPLSSRHRRATTEGGPTPLPARRTGGEQGARAMRSGCWPGW